MKKMIFIALALAVLMILLFFVPIKQDTGSIKKVGGNDSATCELRISNYRYRLLLGERNKYEEARKTFSTFQNSEPCSSEIINIKLYLL